MRTDMRGADLQGAFLRDADLSEANLAYADLTDANGLTQSQLAIAMGDERTKLPPGLARPQTWK